jgi:nucleotide-binding universal stress UspA family protein
MFKRILVPLDGSARAEVAPPLAACLARAAGGVVVLARVVSPPNQHRLDFVQPAPPDTLLRLHTTWLNATWKRWLEGTTWRT